MENFIYIELNLVATLIVVLLLVLLGKAKNKFTGWKYLFAVFCLVLVILALDTGFWLVNGKTFSGARELNGAFNYLYYVVQGVACCIFGLFCMRLAELKMNRWQSTLYFLPLLCAIVLSSVNPCTEILYGLDADNLFFHPGGAWYPIYQVCCVFYLLFGFGIFAAEYFKGRKEKDGERKANSVFIMLVIAIPFLGTAIQILLFGTNTWICGVLSLTLMYARIQGQIAYRMERELTERRIETMRSQIQPHFIFNILTTIRGLCQTDGAMAEEAVVRFSDYLRANIDSLTTPTLISFEKEFEYIETYISLEKMRFGERLEFRQEIESQNFSVPMLSIQPIVENAVHHGISKKKEGGVVRLRTTQTQDKFVVIVADNGVGFDLAALRSDKKSHTGIENTRVRVEELCGGNVNIWSEPGVGTEVRIVIPKKRNEAGERN